MEKYLQACEVGGSLYGKKRAILHKKVTDENAAEKEDLTDAYSKLYKSQVAAMDKLFNRKK
jgi:hypothetical protein